MNSISNCFLNISPFFESFGSVNVASIIFLNGNSNFLIPLFFKRSIKVSSHFEWISVQINHVFLIYCSSFGSMLESYVYSFDYYLFIASESLSLSIVWFQWRET